MRPAVPSIALTFFALLLLGARVASAQGSEDRSQAVPVAPAQRQQALPADANALLGPYLGFGGGLGFVTSGSSATGLPWFLHGDLDSTSGVIDVRAGYRVHARLAAELLWQYATGWDFPFYPRQDSTMSVWDLTANLEVYPLPHARWQPFAVAGVGVGRRESEGKFVFCETDGVTCVYYSDEKREGLVVRLGAGLDVPINRDWTLSTEAVYVFGTMALSNLEFVTTTLDLRYRFR